MIGALLLLAQLAAPRFDSYPVDLRVTPTTTGARLRLSVRDPRSRAMVRRFTVVHERPMHLWVIGAGLEFFVHDHPIAQPDGVFMIDVALPRAGPYMAVADFLPDRGTPQRFQQMFTTGEAFTIMAAPVLDLSAKVSGGVRVSLDVAAVKAGEAKPITVRLEDAATGAPVSDLEPYFGAPAHLFIVSTDLTEAIEADADGQLRGSALGFAPLLPRAGRYKAWLQFQRAGNVGTAAFVFDVP
jgi:hypothetical protein